MYLLDTNIVSYWMRGDEAVLERIKDHSPSDLALSAVTLAEILYGIRKSPTRKRERHAKIHAIATTIDMYPFDEQAGAAYAVIRCQLESTGEPISERDTQIAAIAQARNLAVVTHNVSEFGRVHRLKVEDWA